MTYEMQKNGGCPRLRLPTKVQDYSKQVDQKYGDKYNNNKQENNTQK